MAIEQNILEQALMKSFPGAKIVIEDLLGDQDHYALEIVAEQFKGLSLVAQHKMVNQALEFCLGTSLHALKIKTRAPSL